LKHFFENHRGSGKFSAAMDIAAAPGISSRVGSAHVSNLKLEFQI
jgi:hypothetical protein